MDIPKMIKIRQVFDDSHITDIEGAVEEQLRSLRLDIKADSNIAIAVGSRGISSIDRIVRAVVHTIRQLGGNPFIVPAMGSHGGATAEGQKQLLAGYGITEELVGAPIRSSMQVVELPQDGLQNRVYMDKNAYEADGTIVINRIKIHTDFHGPTEIIAEDKEGDFAILVKDRGSRFTRNIMAGHPFDVVGWDGSLYPFTFNANDFEPITGTVHLPPPIHQTFEIKGYVICTFAPRFLDHHPEAIKVPWSHDNTEADEVLFYVRGNFGSRKGVEPGSFTLHPQGIPHGPHPGTTLKSFEHTRTEELAVMFDTQFPLELTEQALAMDDANYPLSWLG